jgi:hypothetical protein
MSKYLNKDERNALIKEFDLGLPCSNPFFYVMKNVKGIYNIKRVKEGAKPKEEPIQEVFDDDVQEALDLLNSKLPGRVRVKKPQPPKEKVVMDDATKELLAQLSAKLGVEIKVPKEKKIDTKKAPIVEDDPEEEDDEGVEVDYIEPPRKPIKQDKIKPVKEHVPETKVDKPKAL